MISSLSVSSSRRHRSSSRSSSRMNRSPTSCTWWLACAILLLLQDQYDFFVTAVHGLCPSDSSSSSTTNNTEDCSTPQTQLTKYKQLWTNQGALDYSYTFRQTCECFHAGEPFNATIVNLVVLIDPYQRLPREFELPTIPSLFQRIQDYITQGADSVHVTYDEDYGYPTYINIDRSELVMDDEYIVDIEDLQITRTSTLMAGAGSDVDESVLSEINSATTRPSAYRPPSIRKRKRFFDFSFFYTFFFRK